MNTNLGYSMSTNQLYIDELEKPQDFFEEPPYKQLREDERDIIEYPLHIDDWGILQAIKLQTTMAIRRCDSLPTDINHTFDATTHTTKNNSREDTKEAITKENISLAWNQLLKDVNNIKFNKNNMNNNRTIIKANGSTINKIRKNITIEEPEKETVNSISLSEKNSHDSQPSNHSSNWFEKWIFQKQYERRKHKDCHCTCRKAAFANGNNFDKYERGRSKSLGYVAAEKVVAFRRCNSAAAAVGIQTATALRERATLTLARRYYPEGGWGWSVLIVATLVHLLTHGIQLSSGLISSAAAAKFHIRTIDTFGWLGPLSAAVSLAISPLTVAFCVRKSTRVTAVIGGLLVALGCLFTSFASQFHQLFFSYGAVVGVGVGLTRDCSTLMVGQYFKRKRELVEIFVVGGSGIGITVMSAFIKGTISSLGWRLGLQAVTGTVFLTFILGTFYRSASLYHPQRRAILHLKNQNKIKRKLKDRTKADDKPPFLDFSTLKSKTVRILLISTGITSLGINTPIFLLALHAEEEGLAEKIVSLQTYLGVAWAVGCLIFGLLILQDSPECRIARQYLTQAAIFVCGLATLALTAVDGNYSGYVIFTWIYGLFCGGYHYSLKMYTYERVRSRNFARAWGFVQCSQAVPIAIGVPLTGYVNIVCGSKAGYYFSSTCSLVGSLSMLCIDLHRRSLGQKHARQVALEATGKSVTSGQGQESGPRRSGSLVAIRTDVRDESRPGSPAAADLTCISEEACLDIPEHLLHDAITSCNKVENYLMLSEYENNLYAELPNLPSNHRSPRWSIVVNNSAGNEETQQIDSKQKCRNNNKRLITIINEASF